MLGRDKHGLVRPGQACAGTETPPHPRRKFARESGGATSDYRPFSLDLTVEYEVQLRGTPYPMPSPSLMLGGIS